MIKISLKVVILIFICLLAGCIPDSKEIDQRTMILGLGIDITEDEEYEVSLQMPVVTPQFSPGGGGGEQGSEFETLMAVHASLWDAIADIEARTPTVLFFGHLKTVVIGEKLARKGIGDVIDLIDRRAPVDNGVHLLVVPENQTVYDVLSFESPLASLPALYISNFFEAGQKMVRVEELKLYEFRRDSNMIAKAAKIPMISTNSDYVIQDHAIFKDRKMIDVLKGKQSSMSSLLKEEKLDNLNYTVEVDSGSNTMIEVSLRINTDSKIEVVSIDPDKFLVKVSGEGELIHIASGEIKTSEDLIGKVEKEVEVSIEENMYETIQKMKDINVEPWLLGHRLWIRDHENFSEQEWLKDRWQKSEITIEVDIRIRETGQRSKLDKKKIGK
ncbi:hypothetical protein CR203_04100 [Salipaludibacillus neizhouensis]|uniref:Uncharacterized protein n=1 Tax=Salipaludibacillus neizhouensis TaxID=885475 RepID=A0A3A9KF61_9BACI|nr:Ger(x)C family spore germination protein [Salipaludibacillus neizhouensis]RKL69221.1 hypothetical protein CR203_04100 [Salipaludibacillus neizhouensis]